jgi:phenylacetate-CoA ligase
MMRSDVKANLEAMRWRTAPGKAILHSSSGTTDDNLYFYFDRNRQAWDRALRMRALAGAGLLAGERQLQFWPMPLYRDPVNRLKDPFRAARDLVRQGMAVDLRPLGQEQLDHGLDLLARYRPRLVVAYPSWLMMLADRAKMTGRSERLPDLRLILCTGEVLYAFQRDTIEAIFGARVAEEYGSHDAGILASEGAAGHWRVHWEHLCVEVLRDGRPARAGEMGELVVTNLHSHIMPFIRYATGDVVTMPAASDDLGLLRANMPGIEGRCSDALLTTDGRLVGNRNLVELLVRETGRDVFSLFQPAPDRILCITTRTGGLVGQQEKVERILRSLLGSNLSIDWRIGTAFRPLISGKHRFVCSPAANAVLAHDKRAGTSLARAWPQRILDAA